MARLNALYLSHLLVNRDEISYVALSRVGLFFYSIINLDHTYSYHNDVVIYLLFCYLTIIFLRIDQSYVLLKSYLIVFSQFHCTFYCFLYSSKMNKYSDIFIRIYSRTRIRLPPWETKKVRTNGGTSYPYS